MTPDLLGEIGSLAKGLFDVELDRVAIARLEQFTRELSVWSKRFNLISVASDEELAYRHVLDSLAPIRFLPDEGETVDLGSGAGFPGLPIAIATRRPVALLESKRRKVNFLRHVIRTLQLDGVRVIEARAEEATAEVPVSAVVARAVATDLAVSFAERMLADGGRLLIQAKRDQLVDSGTLRRDGRSLYELPGGWRHEIQCYRRVSRETSEPTGRPPV